MRTISTSKYANGSSFSVYLANVTEEIYRSQRLSNTLKMLPAYFKTELDDLI